MPNCFQLISKDTGQAERFADIDESLCAHLNKEVDEKEYLNYWYDVLGLGIACGKSFDDLRNRCQPDDELMLDIIDYLDQNYVPDAWAEGGGFR